MREVLVDNGLTRRDESVSIAYFLSGGDDLQRRRVTTARQPSRAQENSFVAQCTVVLRKVQ